MSQLIFTKDVEWRGITVRASYAFTKGAPGCGPSYSHGGLPPEPDEIEFQSAKILDEDQEPLSDLDQAALDAFDEFAFDTLVDHAIQNGG